MTRARQFFHVKSSASGGQSKEKDTHDDMPHEVRRDKSFQNQSRQFLDAEKAQSRGENWRQEAFDRKSVDFKSIFSANQQRRKRLYQEADILREEVFQNNDNKREAVFQAGQTSRAAMYEKEETARVQFFEQFCETRARILIEGRQTREKSLDDIDATIRDRCESLLQAEEDRFLQKECERDTIVENIFAAQTQLKHNLSSDGFLESATQETPSSKLPLAAQPHPHNVPESVALDAPPLSANQSRRVSTPSPPPRHVTPPSLIRSVTPDSNYPTHNTHVRQRPMIPFIHCSHMSSGSLTATESGSSRSPSRQTSINLSQSDDRQQNQDNIPGLQEEEESFDVSERRRSQDFEHEGLREERFQAAESRRDRAESERSRLFEEQELQRQNIFQAMLKMQGDHYLSREQTRADAADRREESFLITQDQHEQAFGVSIDDFEERIRIEDSLEESLNNRLKHRIEVTAKQQNDRLKMAADDQQTRFFTAQLRRRTHLGIKPPCPDLNQEPHMEQLVSRYRRRIVSSTERSSLVPPRKRSRYRRRIVSSTERSSLVPPHRARFDFHTPSPPTGFTARALFKGADTSDPLPIPKTKIAIKHKIRQDSGLETVQRRHQILFEQSQSRREQVFQQGMERRNHIFNVNEQRRALDFEQKQRSRQAIFEKKEDERERSFNEAQHQQEMTFLAAERHREVSFRESEGDRHRRFQIAQKERGRKFHAKLEELQTGLFVKQENRLMDLKIWSTRLLEDVENQGKDRFRKDEAEHDKIFHSMLVAACYTVFAQRM